MNCPICGGPIGYISRRGPMDAIVNPCGCQLGSVSVTDLLEGDRRDVLTDGGTATDDTIRGSVVECPVCGIASNVEKGTEDEMRELLREKCPRKPRDEGGSA